MQSNVVRSLTVRGQSQGLDKVKSDLDAVSAAQVKVGQTGEGMAKTTETVARRQLSAANSFDRLMEKHDRLIYLQRQMEREQTIVNRAFETGHISVERHGQAISGLNARFDRLIAAEQAARQQTAATSAAMDQQASSAMRLAVANDNLAAANDNARGSTANVAAQFQDIGVTAAMGMNPIMIALQQGTQLSAVLNTMQSPIKGLAVAFMSILNPVSLLTIGFVALTAAAIQFFTSSKDEEKEAASALEEHNEWLDKILAGYDSVRDAAKRAGDEARKLPQEEADLALSGDLVGKQKAYAEALVQVRQQVLATSTTQETLMSLMLEGGEAALTQRTALLEVQSAAQAADPDLNALALSLKDFIQNNPESVLLNIAQAMLDNVEAARSAKAEVRELEAALRELPQDVQITLRVSQEYGAAIGEISDLYMDPRSRFDIARENLKNWADQATATAQTYSELAGVGSQYTRVLDSINAAEAAANAKRAASAKATPAEKAADKYGDMIRDAQQYITEQEMTASALGLTAEATARLRFEQEMLNEAANDNIALSPAQRAEIGSLASQMAAAEERTRSLSESFNFGRGVFNGFFSDLRQGVAQGEGVWEAFYNAGAKAIDKLLQKAMDAALDQVWNNLWGSISGMLGGGFGTIGVSGVGIPAGGFVPGLTGPRLNAKGDVYSSPSLSAYSNQIHDTPKFFQFAKGVGEFAEAGPEAIMPLGRDGSGRLGVRVANDNSSASAPNGVRVEIHNYSGQPVKQETTKGADGVDVTKIIIGAVNSAIAEGRMDSTMAATYGLKRKAAF